ncbi:hypothetical protein SAMN05660461_2288 [Chitinophaga ginsengisegetis]|uniref:Lipoprotein n=1 Tax=Chitinophaga ginsengisegetis TaxID=393003 RepID=A0A1T5NN29_9BACT|nr:hypothetical protein [Chitinophaga ginsengisegetis]SKD01757.1 hypothetical protein SAMN05660461_2288 [Chitinophaga ginsengisegetis]
MTLPKSLAAVLLLASLCVLSCKKDKDKTPDTTSLFVFNGGGNMAMTEFKKLQITPDASYVITYKNNDSSTVKLSGNIHDSLKPYLSSFPRAAIKADPNILNYSTRGAADGVFQVFIYVQKNPTDSTSIYLDIAPYWRGPSYFVDFLEKINQTIANNKIFN